MVARSAPRRGIARGLAQAAQALSRGDPEKTLAATLGSWQPEQASEAELAGIVRLAADAIVAADEDQRIALFNQGAEALARRGGAVRLCQRRGHRSLWLGLAISRSIVEAHGARLDVETAPGCGARFSFVIGVAPAWASRARR